MGDETRIGDGRVAPAAGDDAAATMQGADARVVTLRNLSPCPVIIFRDGGEIALPSLADRPLDGGEFLTVDLERIRASGAVDVDDGRRDEREPLATLVGVLVWVALIGAFVTGAATEGWAWIVGWIGLCVVAGIVGWRIKRTSLGDFAAWVRETAALLLVVVIGFGVPAVVLLFATGLFDDLRGDIGRALDPGLNQLVTYRVLQVVFLGVATIFPALLYFLFDRQHLDTLRCRFLLALFRLDPRITTADGWKARYGRQVAEAFGDLRRRGSSRLLKSRRSPVVLATIVIAIGWVLAFLNLDAVELTGDTVVLQDGSLLRLFEPERGVVAFGFLGAYFFGVNAVLRSYLRGDLRPKAYSQITTRVLIVVVLASVVALTSWGDEPVVLVVAFFAGIVPDTVLQWVWERLPRNEGEGGLIERQPLTVLEGIDLYDRARLSEEGVNNVESLAHGDLVDLLIQTRIPAGRLVDWVDQAVLRLHLGDLEASPFAGLRAVGVRSATDLMNAVEADEDALLTAMGQPGDDAARAKLRVLCGTMDDAEWMRELLAWRRDVQPAAITIDARTTAAVEAGAAPPPAAAEAAAVPPPAAVAPADPNTALAATEPETALAASDPPTD